MSSIIKEKVTLDLIIQEIRTACISQGLNTTEAMANYAVSIVTLDKVLGKGEFKKSKDSLIMFITENAINLLLSLKDEIKQKLMLTQVYFSENFKSEDHVVEEDRKLLNLHAQPLIRHVILYDRAKPDEAMILRQISLITIIMANMGKPTDPAIYKHAEAALASVMSKKEIINFTQLDLEKKRKRLQEIIKLVSGIWIFNQARSDSAAMPDGNSVNELTTLLTLAISSTRSEISQFLEKISKWIHNLEQTIENCFEWDPKNPNLLNYIEPDMDDREFDFVKNVLTLWQQIKIVLRTMHKNVSTHSYEQLKSEDEMRSKVLIVLDKVKRKKLGVPSKEVYPDFLNLSQHWAGFQRRLILINEYNQMLKKMHEYARVQGLPSSIVRVIEEVAWKRGDSVNDEEEETQQHLGPSLSVEILTEVQGLTLEFDGFCPVWLVLTGGLLLSARTNVGVIKYIDKYYGFRDARALNVFSHAPEMFVNKVYTFGRFNPEYIDLLKLRKGLEHGWESNKTGRRKRDKFTQSEIHPVQEYHDYQYRHSIWQLKRDACKFADLRGCRMAVTQTTLSHWRRTVQEQTYSRKETTCQTTKENSTSVPKLQNFAFGLRGQRDEVQHDAILTRPVDERLTGCVSCVRVSHDSDTVCGAKSCLRFGKCDSPGFCYSCMTNSPTNPRKSTIHKNF
ncbi:chromosome 6 open reading frame 165 [Nesidiocoris tenuis]|uniref:Cilia- and flagella-associated protein 206 n=1 Tax=Nesidiocoris tenuis TaxID=355587 RepID=A0ABN7ALW1_9HEMI|nr:chromosome 6 open reading frame 165 [Nesidiocoris tenuis]